MKESVDYLRAQHHQLCFENGDHPDEIDTAYSHAADALERFPHLAAERDALRARQGYDLEMLNSLLDYIERVEKTEHGMDGAVREIARRAATLRGPTFRSVRVRSRSG